MLEFTNRAAIRVNEALESRFYRRLALTTTGAAHWLFLVLATSAGLGWWSFPSSVPIERTLFAVLVAVSVPWCLFLAFFGSLYLWGVWRKRRADEGLQAFKSAYNCIMMPLLFGSFAAWGIAYLKSLAPHLVFEVALFFWAADCVARPVLGFLESLQRGKRNLSKPKAA
jgi:hypothetical protein